jgi:hypothetical protein
MPPDPVIQQLLDIIERQNELLRELALSSQSDPYRDAKVLLLGVLTALAAGYFRHRFEVSQAEEKRKLEEWEWLRDWDRHGRRRDLRWTDLSPRLWWRLLTRLNLPLWLVSRLPEVRVRYIDLRDVNLGADEEHDEGANLSGARLPWAWLWGANLCRADLRYADLRGARLWAANLQEANLGHVNLRGANLRGANLRGAGMEWVDLRGASLEWVDLQGADLRAARLRGAVLHGARVNDDTQWPEGFTVPDTAVGVGG